MHLTGCSRENQHVGGGEKTIEEIGRMLVDYAAAVMVLTVLSGLLMKLLDMTRGR